MIHADEIRAEWRRNLDHGFTFAPPPPEIRDHARAYIMHGVRALPELARLIDDPWDRLDDWDRAVVEFFRQYAPPPCWGSRKSRLHWQLCGGMEGFIL